MPIILNKRKDFQKTTEVPSSKLKAQDETIQITKKEWEAMQESLSQLQTFMTDLVEGNLEIEIVDEGGEEKEEPVEKEEEEAVEIEVEEPIEEAEEKPEEEEAEKSEEPEEEKLEDADLDEVMKDPEKRKAVLEYLKATDSIHPIKDLSLSKIRKRVNTIVAKEQFDTAYKGKTKMTPSQVINEIMDQVKKEKQTGKEITVDILGKISNRILNSLNLKPATKAKDSSVVKRKTIKKSIDAAIPDFTSRFEDKPRVKKAVDNSNKKDLSKEFSNRFN